MEDGREEGGRAGRERERERERKRETPLPGLKALDVPSCPSKTSVRERARQTDQQIEEGRVRKREKEKKRV